MRSCPRCDGFVPPSLTVCPHCEASLAIPGALTMRGKIVTSLMVGSTAMTLMACYGAPCGADDACGYDETGGDPECDMMQTPEPLDTLSAEGVLLGQPGTNRGTCGGSGYEVVYEWTPPAAGMYRMSVDANPDTVLYVRTADASMDGSCGDELACADDSDDYNPELTISLGTDPVFVVVDGYNPDAAGSFTLTIEAL